MNQQRYYNSLKRPRWSPPSSLFGIVWPFLYALIIISFGYVTYAVVHKSWSAVLLVPVSLNLITNGLYSPLFFRWKRPLLATFDTYAVVATLLWFMLAVWPYAVWPVLILTPYLAWTLFASVLQTTIWKLNS